MSKQNCKTCASFPCIDSMASKPDRKYWASLIPETGCQSWNKKEVKQP